MRIAAQRAQQLEASDFNTLTESGKKTIVIDWMQSYIDQYSNADKSNMQGALKHFKDYLKNQKVEGLTMHQLSELIIMDYRDCLTSISTEEGGASYFARLKKRVKRGTIIALLQYVNSDSIYIIK